MIDLCSKKSFWTAVDCGKNRETERLLTKVRDEQAGILAIGKVGFKPATE